MQWHWWRSGWDGLVHAWSLPDEPSPFLTTACGREITIGRIVCDQNARVCTACVRVVTAAE